MANSLIVKIGANISEYLGKMNQAVKEAQKTAREIERQFKGLTTVGSTMANVGQKLSLGITLPLTTLGGAAVKAAGEMEQTQIAFTTMLKSGAQAQSFLKDLRDFAKSTPFEFNDLTQAAKKMMALGFSSSEVLPTLHSVGDAASALGVGSAGVDRITLALGQMRLKGKASAEEMKQLVEVGVDGWGALAKALNTDVAGAMNLVEKRMVDGKVAAQIIVDEMSRTFAGGMEAQSKTMTGKWSNLMDNLADAAVKTGTRVSESLDLAGKLDAANKALEWFDKLPESTKSATVSIGLLAAAFPPVIWVVGKVAAGFKDVVKVVKWVANSRLGSLISTGFSGPIGIALGYLIYKLDDIREAWKRLKSEWENDRFLNELQGALTGNRADTAATLATARARLAPKVPDAGYQKGTPAPTAPPRSTEDDGKKTKTFTDLWNEEVAGRFAAATNKAISAMVDAREVAFAWGKKLEYVHAKIGDTLTVSPQYIQTLLSIADETRNVARANNIVASGIGAIQAGLKPYKDMNEAIKALGITTDHDLNTKVEQTAKLYDKARQSGLYSARDLIKVEYELLRAKEASGNVTAAELARLKELKIAVDGYGQSVRQVSQKTDSFSKEVSTILTNMNQSIADSIVHWKGFGSVALSTLQSIGKAIISNILNNFVLTENRIKKVSDAIGGAIFGSVSDSAKTAVDTAKTATTAAAQASKSLASATTQAVSSTLSSTVGMITGAVSAVTGVIGVFQQRAMNKSLDIIVKHTLETTNELRNLRSDEWTREGTLMRKLDDLWNTMLRGNYAPSPVAVGVGGGTTNISIYNPQVWDGVWLDRLTDEISYRIKLRS